jgi:YD repeat-containing protein
VRDRIVRILERVANMVLCTRDGQTVDTSPAADAQPETTKYHYDLLSRPDYTELPDGVVEDYLFDSMDRLDVLRHYASDADNTNLTDNALKAIYDYDYDPDLNPGTNNPSDGKRYRLTETFYTSTPLTNTYTWKYDDAGRLTEETIDSTDNSLDRIDKFDIDLMCYGPNCGRIYDRIVTVEIYNSCVGCATELREFWRSCRNWMRRSFCRRPNCGRILMTHRSRFAMRLAVLILL